jgi:hypothetical protein
MLPHIFIKHFEVLIVFGGFVPACSLSDRFDLSFAFQLSSPE